MQLGERGLAVTKEHEGLRLDADRCPAKVWTISYGSTGPHVRAGKSLRAETAAQRALVRAASEAIRPTFLPRITTLRNNWPSFDRPISPRHLEHRISAISEDLLWAC